MDMFERPKIDIPKTKMEWVADGLGYLSLAAMLVVLFMQWGALPEEIPAHFGANGEVDRWGSKWELLILPGIAIGLNFFLLIFEKFPQVHNYPERLNESNVVAFYTNSRQTINYIKNIINLLFAYLVYNSISIALSGADSLGWPFYFILVLLFVVLGWKIVKSTKIK